LGRPVGLPLRPGRKLVERRPPRDICLPLLVRLPVFMWALCLLRIGRSNDERKGTTISFERAPCVRFHPAEGQNRDTDREESGHL